MKSKSVLKTLLMYILVAIGIFIVVMFFVFVSSHNSIVRKENAVDTAFSSVDIMLKKRLEIVPQLAATVNHYLDYEKDLLLKIESMHLNYLSQHTPEEKVAGDNALQMNLMQLQKAVNKNTELASNKSVLQLHYTLVESEEHISAARRFYNNAVMEYNNKILSFPGNYIAKWKGKKTKKVFSIPKFDRISPQIEEIL